LEFYKGSPDSDEKKIIFGKFEIVVKNLTETLNELIETLKVHIDNDKECETLAFEELFNTTMETFSGHIMESRAIVTHDFSKAEILDYPKSYLESIMLNLLSNAIKYRSPERQPKIHFWTEWANGKVMLAISDNGLGIDLNKYGRKLFKFNSTFHSHPDAKGVGLYMTKVQIESMGGHIEVESKVDMGTTFRVTF
jgi:light-regulated signal transduction histidine kinase (bacteriophytochrome)